MGDNAWLLLAIHHYKTSTGDTSFDEMEENIVNLLKLFQIQDTQHPSCSYIVSGWENGYTIFNEQGHTEGNLDAHKALFLSGETTLAEKVKCWLDYNDLDWKNGPLDLHAWRTLSLGSSYGFAMNDTEQYKRTINYNGKDVIGFVPFSNFGDNIWSEGTGSVTVSFYKAGYKNLGDNYVTELAKLLFVPKSFKKTKTIAYLALPGEPGYEWVDTNKGHVAGVCWYIFARKRFDPFDGLTINSFHIDNPIHMIQAENYATLAGQVRLDSAGLPYEGKAIHIGGDSGDNGDNNDYSGSVEYNFKILTPIDNATISMRYAEDVQGDICNIYLDDNLIQSIIPENTGGWNFYIWTDSFSIGNLDSGIHSLKVEGIDKKTYGFTIDSFQIDGEATEE